MVVIPSEVEESRRRIQR